MFIRFTAVVAMAMLAAGCATQTFLITGNAHVLPTAEQSQHFFVSGLGQRQTVDAAAVCGGAGKVLKVEAHHSFLNGILGLLSYGIYTPRNVRIYCRK